jgi:hypothetical protein
VFKSLISPGKTIELLKTIYNFTVMLPESSKEINIIFANQKQKIELLNAFGFSFSLN